MHRTKQLSERYEGGHAPPNVIERGVLPATTYTSAASVVVPFAEREYTVQQLWDEQNTVHNYLGVDCL